MASIIALYIRLSVEDEKYDSLSVENQQGLLREKAMSLTEYASSDIREFIDNGHTGTNFERPAVQELLDLVRAGMVCTILVKDLSRFGRNQIETGYFIEKVFPLYHVRFISVDDAFDSDEHKGDTGGIELAFKYLINEYYSLDISKKAKSSYRVRMKSGRCQSVNCIFGYKKGADGRLTPDDEAAEYVRQIFQWAADGLNSDEIVRKLYELKVPTPAEYKAEKSEVAKKYDISRAGGVWLANGVRRIIRDERYIGTYIAGTTETKKVGGGNKRLTDESEWVKIPDHHEPIVSRELFEAANQKMPKHKTPKPPSFSYLLKSRVYCGCCDHALATRGKVTKLHYCKHSTLLPQSDCRKVKIRVADLEHVVFNTIRAQASLLFGAYDVESTAAMTSTKQEEHDKIIQSVHDSRRELYERYILGELDTDSYRAEKAILEARLAEEKKVGAQISAEAQAAQNSYKESIRQKEIADELNAADNLTKSLVDLLIKKVYVFPDNRIEIEYTTKSFLS